MIAKPCKLLVLLLSYPCPFLTWLHKGPIAIQLLLGLKKVATIRKESGGITGDNRITLKAGKYANGKHTHAHLYRSMQALK